MKAGDNLAQRTTIKSGSARPGEVQEGRTVLERGQKPEGGVVQKRFPEPVFKL